MTVGAWIVLVVAALAGAALVRALGDP